MIWKYDLTKTINEIEMPKNAWVLSAQYQDGELKMWAKVDPDAPKEKRRFTIVGTGHEPLDKVKLMGFIATVQQGPLVWHVFECE